jgi:hypothetical protein
MRLSALMFVGLAILAGSSCGSTVGSDDSLPYWFVVLEGQFADSSGATITDGDVLWEHKAPSCETSAAVERVSRPVDATGRYRATIQVETADGCFVVTGTAPGRGSVSVVRQAEALPLRQRQPYDTVTVDLILE